MATPEAPQALADGRYQIKRFLGEGGRKRVYLASDSALGRDVAIALIKTAGLDETGVTRARREAEAMGRLGDHPHIVTVFDIGEEAGQLYIVSQFMPGGDLQDLMQRSEEGRVAADEAIRLGAEIARGLAHAHAHGIIHRDLKPTNVWLTEDGTAKLGDFGLAVALDRTRMTVEGMMVGTVAYMPPEQGLGRAADARSDLYSLGTLLYELVCQRPPFVGDDAVAVISQHINTPPVAPSWHNSAVPKALEELILKLLAKAPEERPESAADVAKTLDALASGEFVAPEPIAHDRANPLDRMAGGVFVGRERETTELRAALEAVLSGQGRLVTLVGEMGIGKTRIAAELGTYAQLRGAQVLWGRCYEGEGAPAYWPWVQVIRSYVHNHDPESLAAELGSGASDIAQLVSEVRDRLPAVEAAPQVDGDQARFRLFDAIASFLRNASNRQPLVLVLDDLHWADRSSLLLLQFLATELANARILIVVAYRDAELGIEHPLPEVLGQLRRERVYRRVLLRGLSFEEVRAMLESVAEHDLRPEDLRLVKALHRETEGNPFFIEEIVRHLVETGQLVRRDGRWVVEAESIDELGIPEGVRETLGRRIERLSESCRSVLLTASAIGREFDLNLLQATAQASGDEVLEALDEALEARVIQPAADGVGRYRFGHGLTREALYEQHSAIARMRLHERIARRLEELNGGGAPPHIPELAHHFTQAMQLCGPEKAAQYGQLAGDRAMSALAYEDAIGHYARTLQALELMPAGSDSQRVDVLLALGGARWRAGETDRAKETFLEAAEMARDSGTPEQLAQAALGYGTGLGWFGFVERADGTLLALLEEALAAIPDEDSVLRVRVLARLAVELYYTHDVDRRSDLSRRALAMAERLGDPEAELIALYSRQSSVFGPRALDERMGGAEEIISAAERIGSREIAFRGRHLRFRTLLELGEIEAARAEAGRLEELAAQLREPFYRWQVGMFRAMDATREGRLADADSLAEDAFAIGKRGYPEAAAVLFGAQTAVNRWVGGGLDELMPGAEALVERYPWLPVWRAVAGFFYTELGRLDEARTHLDVLVESGLEEVPRDGNWLLTMFLGSVACPALGEPDYAGPLHKLLVPFADRWVTDTVGDVWLGPVELALACTAATLRRYDEAEERFARSLTALERTGHRPSLGYTLWWQAKMLAERDAPGDRERAQEVIARGLDTAREIGMPVLVERLLGLKLDLRGVALADIETSIDLVARSVEEERPDLAPHAAPDGTVTLLFSDIEGSTEMTERLGDRRWLELLNRHNELIRREAAAHGGFEVKSQGDGFMLAFSSARRALHCAIAMQHSLTDWSAKHPADALRVRIGLHTGEALKEGDDFFGRHVIIAARVAAEAKGGEVLTSSLLKELTASAADVPFGPPREVELKGLNGSHRVFPVIWDGSPEEPSGTGPAADTPAIPIDTSTQLRSG